LKFAASLEGRATVTADINFVQKAEVNLSAFSTLSGDINFVQKAQASLLTSASVTGNITIPKTFNASLLATGTTTADLTVGSSVDADAAAFFARVTAAGGTLTTTEQNAVNTLVIAMKADGIWTKMKAIYPMVGASAAACAQNLKSASFTGTFSSGWTFGSTGITPNGTSAFFNTSLNASTNLTLNNNHQSFYSRTTESNTSLNVEMGCNTPGNFNQLIVKRIGGESSYENNNYTNNIKSTFTNTDGKCFILGSRTTATINKIYRNGILQNTASGNNTNVNPTTSIFIGATSSTGTATNFSNLTTAFNSIGDGLTDTEAANFYTAVQAFQTTLNRQV
jgi:hypothetical protein